MKQISILGCGWLGFTLAKSFISNGYLVNGSTTTYSKISELKDAGINPFQITLSEFERLEEKNNINEINSFLKNSDVLIINIPPKLRGDSKENFVEKIQSIISNIELSIITKVIFISSTSVYKDDNSIITEISIANPETESGKQLLETERLLQNNTNFETTIIRFGGLIGEDRNPIKFLSGKKHIENPVSPINLIHQKDCIGIIESIIKKNCWGEIFNGVAPFHPTRKMYYAQKAVELNLPIPEFDYSKPSVGKTILSDKVQAVLNYKFQVYP